MGAFTVYPNPSSGKITIDLGLIYEDITIVISNLSGQKLATHVFEGESTISLKLDVPSGFYILHLTADDKSARVKLFKK